MKNYLFDSDKEDTEDEASLRNRLERMGPNPSSYTTHLICSKCRCSRSAI